MPSYIYKYLHPENLVVGRRKMMAFPVTSEVLAQVTGSASDPFDRKYLHTSTTHEAENTFKSNPHFRARQRKNTQTLIL